MSATCKLCIILQKTFRRRVRQQNDDEQQLIGGDIDSSDDEVSCESNNVFCLHKGAVYYNVCVYVGLLSVIAIKKFYYNFYYNLCNEKIIITAKCLQLACLTSLSINFFCFDCFVKESKY